MLGLKPDDGGTGTGTAPPEKRKASPRPPARGQKLPLPHRKPHAEGRSRVAQRSPWGEECSEASQEGRRGDRWERRDLRASSALREYLDWPYGEQVCCIEREVTRKGATRRETAYAITSLGRTRAGAKELMELWRGHWRIENRLHWVREVGMGEDASQVRRGAAPRTGGDGGVAQRGVELVKVGWSQQYCSSTTPLQLEGARSLIPYRLAPHE